MVSLKAPPPHPPTTTTPQMNTQQGLALYLPHLDFCEQMNPEHGLHMKLRVTTSLLAESFPISGNISLWWWVQRWVIVKMSDRDRMRPPSLHSCCTPIQSCCKLKCCRFYTVFVGRWTQGMDWNFRPCRRGAWLRSQCQEVSSTVCKKQHTTKDSDYKKAIWEVVWEGISEAGLLLYASARSSSLPSSALTPQKACAAPHANFFRIFSEPLALQIRPVCASLFWIWLWSCGEFLRSHLFYDQFTCRCVSVSQELCGGEISGRGKQWAMVMGPGLICSHAIYGDALLSHSA